jgi:hypothetical protein
MLARNNSTGTAPELSVALSRALEALIIGTHRSPEEPPTLYIDSKGLRLTSQASVSQDNPAAVTVTYDLSSGRYRVFPGREASNSNLYQQNRQSEGDSNEVVNAVLMSGVTELQSGAEVKLAKGVYSLKIKLVKEESTVLQLSASHINGIDTCSKTITINPHLPQVIEIGRNDLNDPSNRISTVQLTLEACPNTESVIAYPGKLPPGSAKTIKDRLAEAPFRETTYLHEGENFKIGGVSVSLPKLVDSIAKLGTSTEKTEYLRRLLEDISKSNIDTTAKITRLTEGDPAKFLTALGYKVNLIDIKAPDNITGLFNLPKINPDTKEFHLPRFKSSELQQVDSNLLSAIAGCITAQYSSIFLHLAVPQPSSPPQKPS